MKIRRFTIAILALALLAGLAALVFYPRKNGPSGVEWLVAMVEGRGKPHYPISGTADSRMEDFLNRHPRLRPQWRDVPDEENRFLILREFVGREEINVRRLTIVFDRCWMVTFHGMSRLQSPI